jgi:uncharacterized protein (DUF2236 family)
MDTTESLRVATHAEGDPHRDQLARAEEVARELDRLAGGRSVSREINSEVVMLLSWGPAILMQLAHPLVAAGVADHSAFANAPSRATRLGRLRSTLGAMLDITFGTPEQVARATQGINAIHDYVHGRLDEAVGAFPAGAPYSAHDPELLRWVHATLSYCLPRAYELYVRPLTREEKDRYCLEASLVAPLLGIPEGCLPESWAELEEYMESMLDSGRIAVGRAARGLARELLNPLYPRILWPLYWPAKLPAIGLLPPRIREAYGFPWTRSQRIALEVSAALLRRLLPAFPSLLRFWPPARRFARSRA